MHDSDTLAFRINKLLNGSIIALALLSVLEGEALTEWSAMATIFATLLASAVSEAFSRRLADEIARGRRPTLAESAALLRNTLFVLIPGFVPAAAFAAVSAGWLSLGTAFAGACWLLVFALFVAGFMACKAGGGRPGRGLLYGVVICAFGLGIVALQLMVR